ncbi:MAG: ATP-binding protein [Acidimicrobiales bacterium]
MERDYSKAGQRPFTEVYGSVRDARAAVYSLDLPDDLAERAALVVTELAANALLHAGGMLYARLWYGGAGVRVEVADPSEARPELADDGATSGRGLRIVSAMATSWGTDLRPGGKVVWAELE